MILYYEFDIWLILCRDGGIAIIKQKSNQFFESTEKKTIKLFNEIYFKIFIDIVNSECKFLDATLYLTNNEYKPFCKENFELR